MSAEPAAAAVGAPAATASDGVRRAGVPLGAVVAIACTAQFMVVLDTTIVNVALPDMRRALDLSVAGQQWVVTAYLVTFGGFLLLAARASDLLGRRLVFQAGLVVFSLASLAGGLAGNGATLLAARAVQGLGAAALAPASLSLITASHHEPADRTRALSVWSAAASSAGAAGMILGGVLTDGLSWRWVLFVNVPIGLALYLATVRLLATSAPSRERRLDLPGAVLITAAVAALVFGISRATQSGWGSAEVVASLVGTAVLLGVFVLVETRVAQPLIPPSIYRHHNLRLANLITAALGALMTSTIFFLSVYQQQLLGYSPLRTGLSLVPWTLVLVVGTFAARRLMPLLRPVPLLVLGSLCTASGLVWLSWLPASPAYLTHVLGPTIVLGVGMSLVVLPVTVLATSGVAPTEAGLASGLLNMGRQIGGALGLAILVTVATTVTNHTHGPGATATVHGYHIALRVAAGLSAATALGALRLLARRPAEPEPHPSRPG
ncbi:Puromycin resistance protein pur8 [Frankia canadensis]|uniref:Puromycin resistance protein pur8 n=1 Tax=Frankia canadensis TaxID=1836972 RepID=A0A2I2KSK3_9ACTN|nr:MFS transporter [Frankia canadensis]SNQ48645.1 Puromycin resistance protein pur8 [Frankia canadensis]SOU55935.1 Puromycin resistance protein pur8 [Frankia canadensis]